MKPPGSLSLGLACLASSFMAYPISAHEPEAAELIGLGFEQLMDIAVSTPARKSKALSQTPSAVYVIGTEEIRRSGANSIPEALRLAPGVAVAQLSPSAWSVSMRGFGGRFAGKLLVLMDGRSVYTPLFSGVYWEFNDTPLEAVERIEVIRGPGATLWGANAVNGVINIITRSAADTRGGRVKLGIGTEQGDLSARWGGELTRDAHLRLYAKADRGDGFEAVDGGGEQANDYRRLRGGFRADWTPLGTDQFLLLGDWISGELGRSQTLQDLSNPPDFERDSTDEADVKAANLLGRWERSLAAHSEMRLQAYLDYYRIDDQLRRERVTTLDLDMQHRFGIAGRHDIVWGFGYRYIESRFEPNPSLISVARAERSLDVFSGFVQDDIELLEDRLWLTLGTKLEHHELGGGAWQPNLRALWTPDSRQTLWGSVARAVRTPSIGELDFAIAADVVEPFSGLNPSAFPALITLGGDQNLGSEKLLAYELGYRRQFHPALTLDAALFYNDYDELRSIHLDELQFQGTHLLAPVGFGNALEGVTYGAEFVLDWRPSERWRIQPTLTLLRMDFEFKPGSGVNPQIQEFYETLTEGTDPQWQFSLRAGWSPKADLDLDLWLRYVSEVPTLGDNVGSEPNPVEEYLTLDLRAAWRARPDLELALVGKNLLAPRHREGASGFYPRASYVPRSLYLSLDLAF